MPANEFENEMLEVVVCPACQVHEYNGMMHWRDGHQYCRRCIYDIWERESQWRHKMSDFVFPVYSDGVDYTQ